MRATIKEIAQRSGLSVPTVSRVLSDKGSLHQEETRKRVLQAARELGYRPNSSARAMRRGRFENVALLQSATDGARSILPLELLTGIHEALVAHEMRFTIASLPDIRLTDDAYVPKILREWAADGLLINYNSRIPEKLVQLIKEYAIPAIWINSQQAADCVFPDDEGGGYDAARHLLALGHTRIAYADFQNALHYSASARRLGYARAMQESGLSPQWIEGTLADFDIVRLGEQMTARLGGEWPTAIISYGTITMRVIVLAAMTCQRQIPQDLSLIDFTPTPNDTVSVHLDSMILPEEEMGRKAVEMLMAKIASPQETLEPCPIPCRLQGGWTTAPPR